MSHQRTTRLLLVRHAESLANASRRLQGRGDDPLSPRGEEQAQRLAAWLRTKQLQADQLFASPLRRTMQTAAAIGAALNLPVQVRNGLREIDLGPIEGANEQTWAAIVAAGGPPTDDGMESPRDFIERSIGTLHGLLAAHEGETLIVVTHGGVIASALAHWLDRNVTRWAIYAAVRNTAVSELLFGERIELLCQDDVEHLT